MKQRPWTMGFGPVLFKAGERRRIDAQPKCSFRAEKIHSLESNAGAHLLGLYVGREEILALNGDSIDLRRAEIAISTLRDSAPALPIELEIENRGSEDLMVMVDVVGTATL